MKDKEVLKKAIEIASVNGSKIAKEYLRRIKHNNEFSAWVVCHICCFTHNFAEAFWGDGESVDNPLFGRVYRFPDSNMDQTESIDSKYKCWQYHLQQMVLCSNPIDYLRKFIPEQEDVPSFSPISEKDD